MSEDAVAPVIAVMLILAVVATFFAAWNAYYVPSMKAQSEISHIGEVETGFLKFSSDIETAASLKENLKLSEPIPLGGGDSTFDPAKSGGQLRIQNARPAKFLRMNWTAETAPQSADYYGSLVNISYEPVGNFWQNQGYRWVNGTVYVTNTERNLSAPLFLEQDISYGLARSLVNLEYFPAYGIPGNCSSLTVRAVNITPDALHPRASGNGNAQLALESRVLPPQRAINATSLNISISTQFPANFRSRIWESLNSSIDTVIGGCPGNVQLSTPTNERDRQLTFKSYPYPNMTLIVETTDIMVGAY